MTPVYNGDTSIGTGPWSSQCKKVVWSDESRFLLHHMTVSITYHQLLDALWGDDKLEKGV